MMNAVWKRYREGAELAREKAITRERQRSCATWFLACGSPAGKEPIKSGPAFALLDFECGSMVWYTAPHCRLQAKLRYSASQVASESLVGVSPTLIIFLNDVLSSRSRSCRRFCCKARSERPASRGKYDA